MTTIHSRPWLVYFRGDGDDGLELLVKVSDDLVVCEPVSPATAARWLRQLADFAATELKAMEPQG